MAQSFVVPNSKLKIIRFSRLFDAWVVDIFNVVFDSQ